MKSRMKVGCQLLTVWGRRCRQRGSTGRRVAPGLRWSPEKTLHKQYSKTAAVVGRNAVPHFRPRQKKRPHYFTEIHVRRLTFLTAYLLERGLCRSFCLPIVCNLRKVSGEDNVFIRFACLCVSVCLCEADVKCQWLKLYTDFKFDMHVPRDR